MFKAIVEYLQEIERLFKSKNATKHVYCPTLQKLLVALLLFATGMNEPLREVDVIALDFIPPKIHFLCLHR